MADVSWCFPHVTSGREEELPTKPVLPMRFACLSLQPCKDGAVVVGGG